jgi:hypothetical protein
VNGRLKKLKAGNREYRFKVSKPAFFWHFISTIME